MADFISNSWLNFNPRPCDDGTNALAIQLAHAGRKASSHTPWDDGKLIPPDAGGWVPIAPSALAFSAIEPPPRGAEAVFRDAKVGQR